MKGRVQEPPKIKHLVSNAFFALRGRQHKQIEVEFGVVQYYMGVHFCMPNLVMIDEMGWVREAGSPKLKIS